MEEAIIAVAMVAVLCHHGRGREGVGTGECLGDCEPVRQCSGVDGGVPTPTASLRAAPAPANGTRLLAEFPAAAGGKR
jgi:hypothetical protein